MIPAPAGDVYAEMKPTQHDTKDTEIVVSTCKNRPFKANFALDSANGYLRHSALGFRSILGQIERDVCVRTH